jgi:c-di-GMP-binding flagellar brake protein YcgR
MNQKSRNTLKKNFNDWAIFSIINNTKVNEKTVLGWKIVAGKKVTVEVVFHIIRKFRNEIVVRAVGPQGRTNLGNLAAGAQKLNFYLPGDMVLFQTEVKQIEMSGDIRIKIPEMIAQIDRRKDLRLFIENGIKVDVEFFKQGHGQKIINQQFKKQCFDVSGGGLSFIISKTEKKFFKDRDIVKAIKLGLDGEEILVNTQIVNILEVEPNAQNELHYKGWKICLSYVDIKKPTKKKIEDFVFRYIDLDEAI